MKFPTILLTTILLFQEAFVSATFYTGDLTVPQGKIIGFSGSMVAPTLPGAGTYYLWPGLQDVPADGVLQSVLDGRSGSWYIGSGWVGSGTSYPWSDGFSVSNGERIYWNYTLEGSTWTLAIAGENSSPTPAVLTNFGVYIYSSRFIFL